jgi:hypothetical protein
MSENLDIYSILSVLKLGIGILLMPLLHANKTKCILTKCLYTKELKLTYFGRIQMRKLLLPLLLVSGFAIASDLDMNNLTCGDLKINSATTLKQVQDKCAVHSQTMITDGLYLGMYEVKFTNSATNEKVTCDFPRQEPTQVVNGCR